MALQLSGYRLYRYREAQMKRKVEFTLPRKRSAVVRRASWHTPSPTISYSPESSELIFWKRHYAYPAINSFYTPFRHARTNLGDSLRLWAHAERHMDKYLRERFQVAKDDKKVQIIGWVNYRLTDEDKERLNAEPLSIELVINEFMTFAYRGYRLSVSYDDYSKAMQASLVCVNPEVPDCGYGISSRHPDLDTALRSLLYKTDVVGEGNWSTFAAAPTLDSWS